MSNSPMTVQAWSYASMLKTMWDAVRGLDASVILDLGQSVNPDWKLGLGANDGGESLKNEPRRD